MNSFNPTYLLKNPTPNIVTLDRVRVVGVRGMTQSVADPYPDAPTEKTQGSGGHRQAERAWVGWASQELPRVLILGQWREPGKLVFFKPWAFTGWRGTKDLQSQKSLPPESALTWMGQAEALLFLWFITAGLKLGGRKLLCFILGLMWSVRGLDMV